MGRVIPYIMEIKHVWNHQPVLHTDHTVVHDVSIYMPIEKGYQTAMIAVGYISLTSFGPHSFFFFRTADILPAKYGLLSEHMTVNLQHCSIRFEVSSFPGCMLGKESSSQPKWTIKSKQIKELQKVLFLPTSSQHRENQPVKCRPWPSLLS